MVSKLSTQNIVFEMLYIKMQNNLLNSEELMKNHGCFKPINIIFL